MPPHGLLAKAQSQPRNQIRWKYGGAIPLTVMPFFTKLEPCGTSHFWGRELQALGHEVKLMPPIYVTPYVKRGKTDAGDAAAICEAVTRPGAQATATASISTFHPGRTRPATTMVVDAALWSAPRCSLRAAASSGT